MSDIEDENEKLQRDLSRLYDEINKINKDIALNAQLMSARYTIHTTPIRSLIIQNTDIEVGCGIFLLR